ncbi:MAG: hypothetical protein ACNI27_15680 [Desulfovibrio sp.]
MKKKFRLFSILTLVLVGLGVGLYYYIQNVAESGFNNWVYEKRNEFTLKHETLKIDYFPPSVTLTNVEYEPKSGGSYFIKEARLYSWDFNHEPPEKMRAEFDGVNYNGALPLVARQAIAQLTGVQKLPSVDLRLDYNLDASRDLLHINDITLILPKVGDFSVTGYMDNVKFGKAAQISNLGMAIRSGSLTFVDKGFYTSFSQRLAKMSGKDVEVVIDEIRSGLMEERAKYLEMKDMTTVHAIDGIVEFIDVPVGMTFRVAPEEAFPLLYLFSDRDMLDFADQLKLSVQAHMPPIQ